MYHQQACHVSNCMYEHISALLALARFIQQHLHFANPNDGIDWRHGLCSHRQSCMCHPGGPPYQAAAARRAARSSSTAAAALSAWRLRSPSPRPASRFHVTPFLRFEAALQPQPDIAWMSACVATAVGPPAMPVRASRISEASSRMPLGALLGASTGMIREGSRTIRIQIAVLGFAAGQDCCVTWTKCARRNFHTHAA